MAPRQPFAAAPVAPAASSPQGGGASAAVAEWYYGSHWYTCTVVLSGPY
jgi:hypothetical protein